MLPKLKRTICEEIVCDKFLFAKNILSLPQKRLIEKSKCSTILQDKEKGTMKKSVCTNQCKKFVAKDSFPLFDFVL